MNCVVLENRGLVAVSGADAQSLLQDVISCGVVDLPDGLARPGALLTPQGKILFDFLLSRDGADRFLFDLGRDQVADFIKRMTMYRLRAKAEIDLVEDRFVHAAWDGEGEAGFLADGRFPDAAKVYRFYGDKRPGHASASDYDRLRVAYGVAESGADYALSDVFPHDVLLDLNGGISFRKGCFVGQEVVSRMQHRGTARRRVVILSGDAPLPQTGAALTAGNRSIGTVGTVAGTQAIAIARIDRIAAAEAAREPLLVADTPVTATLPAWTGLTLPAAEAAQEN
jgi:folate-binding protein YgfZ